MFYGQINHFRGPQGRITIAPMQVIRGLKCMLYTALHGLNIGDYK
jgi:hypothetical protein